MSLSAFETTSNDPRKAMTDDELAAARQTGFPVVAQQFARKDRAGIAVGISLALFLGAITLFVMSNARTQSTVPAAPATAEAAAGDTLATPPLAVPLPPVANQPLAALPGTLPVPAPPAAPAGLAISPADRARSVALIFDTSAPLPVASAATPVATAAAAAAKPQPQGLTSDELFAQRFAANGETATATRMTNPSTTVAQGTLMTAVLETAIDSDLPGFVRAVISVDVKSYDGSQVLIPRGSHVIGEYKSGLAVGQTRAFVQWTRLLRPDGVSIALGSPATDYSGRNGLGGKVNSHFGKRFGAATLLSVIGAAGQAIGGGGTVVVAGPQAVVSSAAQQTMAISPTVRVALGQAIRIFTARDLDFGTISAAP